MPGKLLLKLQIERDHVDQRTCHECPEWRLTQDARTEKDGTIFCGLLVSARRESARKGHAYVGFHTEPVVYGQSPAKSKMGLAAWAKP
jgi:hypothetical protein